MTKETNQLTSSCSVGMQDINGLLQSAPISRIKTLRDDEGRNGFTLIELLVVVLIIGILAAIALPQYQKAVEKSKAKEAMTIIKNIYVADNLYKMETGRHATRFESLDIEIPWFQNTKWYTYSTVTDTRSTKDWSAQLETWGNTYEAIFMGRIAGKYAGAGFAYYLNNKGGFSYPLHQLLCMEKVTGHGYQFQGNPGDYCEKLFHGKRVTTVPANFARVYTIP